MQKVGVDKVAAVDLEVVEEAVASVVLREEAVAAVALPVQPETQDMKGSLE